ncbi:5'-methylthioadenosine/S-adenosylhomocysteine nucleosidase [Aestuariimicrobium sp. T2.26MG-19.2B]|nr:5'-methylthioadenosine/S-adenosylhomocysteine nucleosidase [Aestuariimicrobium sp. T2.26MG-19.2B]
MSSSPLPENPVHSNPGHSNPGHSNPGHSNPARSTTADRTRVRAVIVAAMESEFAPLLARGEVTGDAVEVGGARLQPARLAESEVLLVRSGIGLVNAALATTAALLRLSGEGLEPGLVVSVGSAGGFAGAVSVGQVAVGSEHRHHQADAVAFGYVLGQVPGMPEHFPADPSALAAVAGLDGVVVGPHASADVFVAGPLIEKVLADFPGTVAVEMEATAIAQVAHSFGIGFVSVRGISDLCGVDAAADHAATVDRVSAAAAEVVLRILSS